MGWFYRFLTILLLLAIIGGGVFLMTWDIPPPSSTVEKVIPDERLAE